MKVELKTENESLIIDEGKMLKLLSDVNVRRPSLSLSTVHRMSLRPNKQHLKLPFSPFSYLDSPRK